MFDLQNCFRREQPEPRHAREDGLRRFLEWTINRPPPVMSNVTRLKHSFDSMLTTYASYAVSVWVGFALMYAFGVTRHSDSGAGVWLAILPLMFLAPSVELLLYVKDADRKAITRYVASRRFAFIRLILIGITFGVLTLALLHTGWKTGWTYSQSSTMMTALLVMSLVLAIAGPIATMSFLIHLVRATPDRVVGETENHDSG